MYGAEGRIWTDSLLITSQLRYRCATPAYGHPNQIRTGVTTVKGWCPRPLDHGAIYSVDGWLDHFIITTCNWHHAAPTPVRRNTVKLVNFATIWNNSHHHSDNLCFYRPKAIRLAQSCTSIMTASLLVLIGSWLVDTMRRLLLANIDLIRTLGSKDTKVWSTGFIRTIL